MIDLVPAPATLPHAQRIYAIGDVHGCLERLCSLHEQVAADLAARPVENAFLVHLGDYVDRGPDSAQVVDLLARGASAGAGTVINLMGNHEEMMLAAITAPDQEPGNLWLSNGGSNSLLSWNVPQSADHQDWASRIPLHHLLFLRDLKFHHQIGPYLFVHAGIRPGVALERQKREDLLWIREPFLSSKKDHGVVVVHGHTPKQEPTVRSNRIGVDTGAVMGGVLTCVVLEGDQLGFIHA